MKFISILSFLLILNCVSTSRTVGENIVYIYDCDGIKLIYNPTDSTKIYIFPDFYNSNKNFYSDNDIYPVYQDSTVVRLFESGNITSKLLLDSHPNNNGWHEFYITTKKLLKTNTNNCSTVIPDSNMQIIELMRTSIDIDNFQNTIYSFQITYNYGTVHHCFEIKNIGVGKYAIRSVGLIL